MRTFSTEAKVGVAVLVAFGLLLALTFQIGKFRISRKGFAIEAVFRTVSGLDTKAKVRLAGVHVGASDLGAAETEYKESREIRQQLRSLEFVSITAERGGPGDPPWFRHEFFDATRDFMEDNQMSFAPHCWVAKIGRGLDIPGKRRADWRVGLCETWIERRYCKLRCVPMLEIRVDSEIEGNPYRFTARHRPVVEADRILRCVNEFGESSMRDW